MKKFLLLSSVLALVACNQDGTFSVPGPAPTPAPAPAPIELVQCAVEGGTCNFVGTAPVSFGMNGTYITLTFTGSAPCNDSTFTDPLVGTVKACYVPATTQIIQPAALTPAQVLLNEQNALLVSQGQHPLIQGLDCQLWTVPNGTSGILAAFATNPSQLTGVGSFEYAGQFNQGNAPVTQGLNVLPAGVEPVVQTNYILQCNGQMLVTDDNYHEFDLTSDDGSLLYIDGLLINNDGAHGAATVSATKFLQYGFHSFQIDYFQAQGQEELILNEDGNVMDTTQLYH